ncbi:hypothetical protein THRCLA_03599 [Thraustotheca clavata]|uniref:RAD50-interacting protein 1 n=1 Tax=Thraustotheca clavata TaxID=74557 RepID=A0A1W0A1J8_9STRA|nr:hypothetical protein THRCLA_03599 [Thraustotheca clavata]
MASDMTAMDREFDMLVNEINCYEKGQLQSLLQSAMASLEALEIEKRRVDKLLPELQAKQKHHNMEQHTLMNNSVATTSEINNELSTLREHTGQLCAILEPQTEKLSSLQSEIEYLKILLRVETISNQAKQEKDGNIDALVELAEINSSLPKLFGVETSLNLKLRTLITDRLNYLAHAFQIYHTKELEAILDDLQWPLSLNESRLTLEADKCSKFSATFKRLVQLQMSLESVAIGDSSTSTMELWAMNCLTKPIVRRFHYHFDTSKKTNDITKPEWFFTYITEALNGHYEFIQGYVAPVLNSFSTPKQPLDAMTKFIQALLEPVQLKVTTLLPLIVENKHLLCHAIDEIVAFENTLRVEFGYQPGKRSNVSGILDICSQSPKIFNLWMEIDRDYAQAFITNSLQSNTAWDCIVDDDNKVTNAAYAIASCFTMLIDRFQPLSEAPHRYEYVVQVVKPFLRHCYTLIAAFAKTQRTWNRYGAAINSASYIALVLEEWDNLAVFVELLQMAKAAKIQKPLRLPILLKAEKAQEVKNTLLGPASLIVPTAALSAAFSAGSNMWHALHHNKNHVGTKEDVHQNDEELVLEGSMFESEIAFFKKLVYALEADMLNASVTAVLEQWEHYASSPIWSMPSTHDWIIPEVSSELGNGLALAQKHLTQAKQALSDTHFQTFWQRLAKELDGFLLNAILSHKIISGGGREQLQIDVHCLVDIFRCHTKKPLAYLRGICDACTVLKMENKKAATLTSALDVGHKNIDAMEQLTTMLVASQILALRPSQVLGLLRA